MKIFALFAVLLLICVAVAYKEASKRQATARTRKIAPSFNPLSATTINIRAGANEPFKDAESSNRSIKAMNASLQNIRKQTEYMRELNEVSTVIKERLGFPADYSTHKTLREAAKQLSIEYSPQEQLALAGEIMQCLEK